jgi:integrase
MRTRTHGIQLAGDGSRLVDKEYKGRRIYARLGVVSQEAAESWLRQRQNTVDVELNQGTQRNFSAAARRYLNDCERRRVRTIETIAFHITLILPYIGNLPLESVHSGTLQAFCDRRIDEDKVKPATVNRTLEVVRSILTKAARVWRTDEGKSWLSSAPLIEMLDTSETKRQPRPITWDEQRRLFAELPQHLQLMALFAVNTGLRDNNVCGLRWQWERHIDQLKRSVFVIPAGEFKSKRPHVAILNDVATNVMESCRGAHPEFVFAYSARNKANGPGRIETINNSSWQKARARAGLEQVRVHDLRHTFGQRLRDAGVSGEDRAVLMGHATQSMSEHYATPTIARLIEMANLVTTTRDTPTLLGVVNG